MPASVRELEVRAQALCHHSIGSIAAAMHVPVPTESRFAKGFVGQLLECALGADPKAGSLPDFPHLGIELKTIPVDPAGTPVESTFCCSIHMQSADTTSWETSRLRQRLQHVLWLPVTAAKYAALADRLVGCAYLWSMPQAIERILQADWEDLMGAIGAGYGSSLSAHKGRMLQVRPKAANAKQRTLGCTESGPDHILPLGFYLRRSATAAILSGKLF